MYIKALVHQEGVISAYWGLLSGHPGSQTWALALALPLSGCVTSDEDFSPLWASACSSAKQGIWTEINSELSFCPATHVLNSWPAKILCDGAQRDSGLAEN